MMTTFKPLLASTCENLSTLRYPVLASPKLDGIRCVKLNGRALTRKLKPIPNTFVRTWIQINLPDGIDGELLLRDHRTPFNEVSSAIMSEDGEPDFVFAAFDLLTDENARFASRFEDLEYWEDFDAPHAAGARLIIVSHMTAYDEADLREIVIQHLDRGYEGTMVRDPAGHYKFGRSTLKEGILLKIKQFVDEEAVVIGVVEQMHNENEATVDNLGHTKRSSAKAGKVGAGKLGALKCRLRDGTEFEIGTGFTNAQRVEFWAMANRTFSDDGPCGLNGRQVKFKYQRPPVVRRLPGEAPRFPVFLGWRED